MTHTLILGANLSGDLKDPSSAIPKGTLGAIALTYVTYSYFAVQTGFIFKPQASGIKLEYQYDAYDNFSRPYVDEALANVSLSSLPLIDECNSSTNAIRDQLKDWFKAKSEEMDDASIDYYRLWGTGKGCEHGSALDQMTMTYTSFTGYLRYVSICIGYSFRFFTRYEFQVRWWIQCQFIFSYR